MSRGQSLEVPLGLQPEAGIEVGLQAEIELVRDLLGPKAFDEEQEHLELTGAERRVGIVVMPLAVPAE